MANYTGAVSPGDEPEVRSLSAMTITKVALTTRARVPGLDEEGFQKAANTAKDGCVISRALGAIDEVTLDATLES